MTAVTICSDFGVQEKKVCPISIISPSICHEVMGPDAMIFIFWMSGFKLGEGNGNPLQYSCLENPGDRGTWWALIYGVAQSRTQLKWLSSSSSSSSNSFKPAFSFSSFTFNKRLFSSSSLSAIRVVSSAYLRLFLFLLAVFIQACFSSSPAFHMMYSALS